jgi:hypothetical protein
LTSPGLPVVSGLELLFVVVDVFLFRGVISIVGAIRVSLQGVLVGDFLVVNVSVVFQLIVNRVLADIRQEAETRVSAQARTRSVKSEVLPDKLITS